LKLRKKNQRNSKRQHFVQKH